MVLDVFFDVQPTTYPALPWLDMLPASYPDRQAIVNEYLSHARLLIGSQGGDWPDYRYATYLFARDRLRLGCSRQAIRRLLDQMAEQEQYYRKQRGLRELTPG
jgi:hypothetical protein